MLSRTQLLSTCCQPNLYAPKFTQVRAIHSKYRHGPTSISNPRPDYVKWFKSFFGKEGWEFIKSERKRIIRKMIPTGAEYPLDYEKTYVFEDFDSDDSIKRWKPVSDSESLNGFSTSTIVRSPAGHGLFKGVLDTRIPDDGVTMRTGFSGIIGPRKPRDHLLTMEEHWDWSNFNSLDIRFRGDGRKYMIVVNTGTYTSDLEYYDYYGFPLYTRGGPHWQTFNIPFTKFVFAYKSFVQDENHGLQNRAHRVKFVSLNLQDTVNGPFALEIDYIGLSRRFPDYFETNRYETYSFPHLKYRRIQFECDPPDLTPR